MSKRGRASGPGIPVNDESERARRAIEIERFGSTVDRLLDGAGLSEEQLIELLGLGQAPPD